MADPSEPNKPVRRPDWKSGKGGSAETPRPSVELSGALSAGPWEWHITETFKGLIALSIEALKALLLINGGAAVAILAYLGSLASHASPGAHLPNMKKALLCFAGGVLATAIAFLAAYFTQLRLYNEERARHVGEPFKTRHSIGLWIATVLVIASAIAFGAGCWIAASAF